MASEAVGNFYHTLFREQAPFKSSHDGQGFWENPQTLTQAVIASFLEPSSVLGIQKSLNLLELVPTFGFLLFHLASSTSHHIADG